MSVTVAISVGHTRDARGAVSLGGVTEFEYNLIVAKHVKRFLKRSGVRVVVVLERSRLGIKDLVRRVAAERPVCAVELHFNSSDKPSSNGIEMLYADSKAYAFGEMVQKRTVQALGLRDRGLKERRTGYGSTYLLGMEDNGIPALIYEPFFGSNKRDWERAKDAHEDVARGVAIGIIDWLMASRALLDRPAINAQAMPLKPPSFLP
jgi:N-acetylmuramoyl-L-alanine amidase